MARPDRPIRVLFLLQRPEAWVNIASIWAAMQKNPEFEPRLWLLPYNAADPVTSKNRAPIARQLLDEKGVAYVEWRNEMGLDKGEFDVAIFNHPYDRERPSLLSFERVAAAVPYTIYVPYGLPVGGGFRNLRYQYAQGVQVRADAVVARSDFEKAQFRKHCPSGDRHVYVTGHPRFDTLLDALEAPIPEEIAQFCGDRIVFLWSSHFSFGLPHSQVSNFSTFDLIGPELFQFVSDNSDGICLIWRPHPGLLPALIRDGILSASEVQILRRELASNGVLLDEHPEHASSFSASDALIADPGSFLLEYLVTGKPILALINPDGEPLNDEGAALVSHYRQASHPEQVETFIRDVQAGVFEHATEEAQAIHLPMLDRRAGPRVAVLAKALVNGCPYFPLVLDSSTYDEMSRRSVGKSTMNTYFTPSVRTPPCPTPVLDKLCTALRVIRQAKSQEGSIKKIVRRQVNTARSWAAELFKRHASEALFLNVIRTNRHR